MTVLEPSPPAGAAVSARPPPGPRGSPRRAGPRRPPDTAVPPRRRLRPRRHRDAVIPLRVFVAGTDTNVGKTEVSVALLQALARRGHSPFAFKPYESGSAPDDPASDSLRLWSATRRDRPRSSVTVHRFLAPLAPGIAARLEGKRPSWAKTLSAFRALGDGPGLVEGAGGLVVPLDDTHDVLDLIAALKLPIVLVARAGLGTLNHTGLSLEALAARGLPVAAVVLVQATPAPDPSVPHNRPELERRFPGLPVIGPLPFIADAEERSRLFSEHLAPLI